VRGVAAKRARARLSEAEARELERFVVRSGGARGAADACGVTPPALDSMRWCGLASASAVAKVRDKIGGA
jgi:hypothetical protein